MRNHTTLALALVPVFMLPVASCATTEQHAPTWDEVPSGETVQKYKPSAAEEAAAFHTDDQCVDEAQRRYAVDRAGAKALMRACVHRDDFMLSARLADKRWQGILEQSDWPAVMRAELRRGGIAELNLAPYGLPSEWLRNLDKDAAPDRRFVVYAETVRSDERAGKSGVLVHPIIYGTRDEIYSYQQQWDLVDTRTGRVVQENVKVTQETGKTGRTKQLAQVVKQPIFLELSDADRKRKAKAGDGLLCIVDRVRLGSKAKGIVYDEEDPAAADEDDAPLPIRYFARAITCVPSNG